MASALVLTYFGRPPLGHIKKINFIKFQTVDPEMCSVLIFIKGSGTSFPTTFCAWIFKKNILHIISGQLIKFHYLVAGLWLLLLFEILDNMSIVNICFRVCDIINFYIKLSFLKLHSHVRIFLRKDLGKIQT